MARKKICFFWIICFFLGNIQSTYAVTCKTIKEESAKQIVERYGTRYEMIVGDKYDKLSPGSSVCGVTRLDGSLKNVIYKCQNDGNWVIDEERNESCKPQSRGDFPFCEGFGNNTKRDAYCDSVFVESTCQTGSDYRRDYYIPNFFGRPELADTELNIPSVNKGSELCYGNKRMRCYPGLNKQGVWREVENCNNKLCATVYYSIGNYFKTECKSGCSNPEGNIGANQCFSDNSGYKIRLCEFYNQEWKTISLSDYFRRNDCISCINGIEPICITSAIDDLTENRCNKIKGTEEELALGDIGSDICNKERTKWYKCIDPVGDNHFYQEHQNCSAAGLECGFGYTGKIGCIPKDEAGSFNQSFSIGISTYLDIGFFCNDEGEIKTAIGCLPITVNGLIDKLLPAIFGIAGGIAFLMMVYGFIMISTSSGDEKKVAAAKQTITSAITGLIVSLFALFLYRLIAVQILHIPGM